jgi:hypothetical protein
MRKSSALITLIISVLLFSSCEMFDNTPGSFRIKFEWSEDEKPDFGAKDYYAWVLLEEWVGGEQSKARLLMQSSAAGFDDKGKVSIDLSDVGYGENRVVRVEIRGSDKVQDRVLFYGRSELFTFSSKDRDKEIKVALSARPTPGTGISEDERFGIKIMQDGTEVTKINDTVVDIRIRAVNGSRIIISNSLSTLEKYLNEKDPDLEGVSEKPLGDLKEVEEDIYDITSWDLNDGLDFGENDGGERIVYGKLLNDEGYLSETVQTSVLVDKALPAVVSPTVSPNPAKLGDTVSAVFSFSKQIDETTLEIDWDGLGFERVESGSSNVFTYTLKITETISEKGYTFSGSVSDEVGNGPVEFEIGELSVDVTPPSLVNEKVEVTDGKEAIKIGDKVTVTFEVSEDIEGAPEVTIDGKRFEREGDSDSPFTYHYTVADSDIEGIKTILVSMSDLARNQNVVELGDTVRFDLSAPEVINPTVTPAGNPGMAGTGTKIEVRFNISEPVSELSFHVNGEESTLFEETVNGLTYTYSRTVTDSEIAPEYEFTVSAVDFAGNELVSHLLGTVVIDIANPSVTGHTLSHTNVKLNDTFTLGLELSEALSSLTVLVGSKDITGGCTKNSETEYVCSHTANIDGDEGDGIKQFSVQMRDLAGNSSTVQLRKPDTTPLTIEYDVTPPAIVNPVVAPSNANSGSTIDVRFSFTEDVEGVAIDFDGLGFERFNSASDKKLFIYKYSVSPESEYKETAYTITVTAAHDMAGNPIESAIEIGEVTIDNTPPVIESSEIKVSGDSERTYVISGEEIEIIFETIEEISEYKVRIGLMEVTGCTKEDFAYTCTYTSKPGDSEGTKDVTVELKDLAGNGASYGIGQLVFDMKPPELLDSLVIPSQINRSSSGFNILLNFSEEVRITDISMFPELSLNCGDMTEYRTQYDCSYPFGAGEEDLVNDYVLGHIEFADRAGNVSTENDAETVKIDRELPYVEVQSPDPLDITVKYGEPFSFSFVVNEDLLGKPVVKIGETTLSDDKCPETSDNTYECTHSPGDEESDGDKQVTVNLRDDFGNISLVSLNGYINYDVTPPELLNPVIIPDGTANRYNGTVQVRFSFTEKVKSDTFSFSAKQSGGTDVPGFSCGTTNDQSYICTKTFEPSDETDDTYHFSVFAQDLAGNAVKNGTPYVEAGTLKVDRKNPGLTMGITVDPVKVTAETESITVTFTVDEELGENPIVKVGDLMLNTPDTVPDDTYTYKFEDLTFLSDGDKSVSVSLVDVAGNQNTVIHTSTVSVDRTLPSLIARTIAPSIANLNTDTAIVNFTFSEKIDGFDQGY